MGSLWVTEVKSQLLKQIFYVIFFHCHKNGTLSSSFQLGIFFEVEIVSNFVGSKLQVYCLPRNKEFLTSTSIHFINFVYVKPVSAIFVTTPLSVSYYFNPVGVFYYFRNTKPTTTCVMASKFVICIDLRYKPTII